MNEELTQDLHDLLNYKRAGHMGRWEYSSPNFENDPVNGIYLWNRFLHEHPEYYLAEAEKKIAQKVSAVLPTIISEPICLVSLGPGQPENFSAKELSLSSRFNDVSQIISLDVELSYITASLIEAQKACPKAILRGEKIDFFKPFHIESQYNVLASMFGGTLFNEEGFVQDGPPLQTTTARLKLIREAIGKGYFFITVDHNQDRQKIEMAYEGQGEFARNLVHRFNRDTPLRFDFEKSAFRVEWHPSSNLLAHYLTLNHHEYHFNNSYKLPKDLFLDCAEKAGFRPIYQNLYKEVTGYLLQSI